MNMVRCMPLVNGSKRGGSIAIPEGKIICEENRHDCVTAFLIEPHREGVPNGL